MPEASKFHEAFRQFVITTPQLCAFSWFQEVNVKDVFPAYAFHNHHYDWVCSELDLIVELHGKQHYKPVKYGGESADQVAINFKYIKQRDSSKKREALDNRVNYMEIPYTHANKITYAYFNEQLALVT